MKKITLLFLTFLAFNSGNAQTNLFSDDFESYTDFIITGIGGWQTLDLDGLPTYTGGVDSPTYPNAGVAMAFQIFNPSTTTPTPATNESDPTAGEVRNFDPYSGAKFIGAWAGVPSTTGGPIANDDWLVSPPVTLAASGNTVTFWAKALSNTYGDESYQVGVLLGTGDAATSTDFTIIGGTRTATYPAWEQVTVDLSAYNSQTVRIGIHYTSSDVYLLMIDDFAVNTTLGIDEFDSNVFTYSYDKDSNVLALNSSTIAFDNIQLYNILGQEVMVKPLSQTSETISLSSLQDGIYMAKVSIGGRVQTVKLLKQ